MRKKELFFEQKKLEEKFNQILSYKDIPVYDSLHAIEKFHERFPLLDMKIYFMIMRKGIDAIEKNYNFEEDRYMIISRKTNIKIPLDLRPDRFSNKIIGVTGTTLDAKKQSLDTFNEKRLIVESKAENSGYMRIPDYRGDIDSEWYNHIFEDGKHYKDFKEIFVKDI